MPGAKPPPLRKRRRSSLPKFAIVAAISVVAIPIILFGVWRWNLSRDIHRLEAKARAAGEPITLQELAATRKAIPDDENAAVALMDIWQEEDPPFWKAFRAGLRKLLGQVSPRLDPDLPVIGQNQTRDSYKLPWSAPQIAAARAFVTTNQARSDRIRVALARPKSQFPINFLDGFNAHLPHLSRVKHEAARLQVVNLLAIADKKTDVAVDQLGEIITMGQTLRDEPCIISQLVRIACIGMALNGTEELLKNSAPDDAQLNRLAKLFGKVNMDDAFHRSMLGESAMGVSVFDKPIKHLDSLGSDENADSDSRNSLVGNMTMNSSPFNAVGFFALDHRLMLQTYNRLIDLSRDGNWDDILKAETVIRETAVQARRFPPKLLSYMLIPALEKAADKFVAIEARRRCALLAVEVARFRMDHGGELPAALEPILASKPGLESSDPFDGKQLRYRILNDGFVVYSVGPDRIDQKGVTKTPRNNRSASDVAFTVGTNGSE